MNPRVQPLVANVPYQAASLLHQLAELRTQLLLAGFDGAPGALALARTVERCHRALRRAHARYKRVVWEAEQSSEFASDASADEVIPLPSVVAERTRTRASNGADVEQADHAARCATIPLDRGVEPIT